MQRKGMHLLDEGQPYGQTFEEKTPFEKGRGDSRQEDTRSCRCVLLFGIVAGSHKEYGSLSSWGRREVLFKFVQE